MTQFTRRIFLCGLAFALTASAAPAKPPLLLAAASLQESMTEAATVWAHKGHPKPVLSFAASSALARQIDAGAPADLFASADEPWMDEVEKNGRIIAGTRAPFLGNQLVVVTARANPKNVTLGPRGNLVAVLGAGTLAMADPDAVPAGKYGKAALEKLGQWTAIAPHVVRGDSVRAALALVERGATPYGVVYLTDAKASAKVRVAAVFPPDSHPPIRYPLARLKAATSPDAEGFRRFLLSGEGKAIFRRYGFTPL